jgi:subtilisin-like proprotein convertase family protein
MRKIYFLLLTVLLGVSIVNAQTTLISPTGDGGFETGTTFAANGWTVVNSSTDAWIVGAAPVVSAGSRCAYISSNGSAWTYSQISTIQHLYRDVTIPGTGTAIINLSFKWKAGGEGTGTSDWDNMKVFWGLASSVGTPAANTAIASSFQVSGAGSTSGMYKLSSAAWNNETISISGVAGSTYRLVFSWKSDISDIVNPPAAIDEILLTASGCQDNPITGTKSVGTGGNYPTLTAALAALNNNGISGNVILELNSSYTSASETFPIVLSNQCMDATNTITIRPAAGVTGRSITTSNTTATLNILGGDYWTIDGRPGGTGTSNELTIQNTNTSGSTIQFINGATFNTIRNTIIRGAATSTTSGVVFFSTGSGVGNSNNTINSCEIRDAATTPTNCIYSIGSSGLSNTANTISNNKIYNFYNSSSTSNAGVGLLISSNNSNWLIDANSFYQTASRTTFGGGTFNAILINSTTVNGTTITGNFIGGTSPSCGGSAMTLGSATSSLVLRAIQLAVGTTVATSVQGNTIQNISVTTTNSSSFHALVSHQSGSVNFGNLVGNTLGSQSLAASVVFVNSGTSTATRFSGIGAGTSAPGDVNISNNAIGGISVSASSTGSVALFGISFQGTATSYLISNNTIGSPSVVNSLQNSSNNSLYGIIAFSTQATPASIVSQNNIVNLSSTSTGTSGNVTGFYANPSSGGLYDVSGNTIRNLSAASASSFIVAAGIYLTGSPTPGLIIRNNVVHTIAATTTTANSPASIGIYYTGPTTGTNVVDRNLVYNVNNAATGTGPLISGIYTIAGAASFQNNIVSLGSSVASNATIYGILDTRPSSGANNNFSIYSHNSVSVIGSASGSQSTVSFYGNNVTNVRSIRNNIFSNTRSNSGTGKNYSVALSGTAANPAGLTIDFNDYHFSGTNSFLGFFNSADVSTLTAWRTAVGQDANSISADPLFVNPTATTPDLHLSSGSPCEGIGVNVSSISEDFDGESRVTRTPVDIGADAGNFMTYPVISYTPIVACTSGSHTLIATITDADGVPTSGSGLPILYWRINTGAWTAAIGVSLGNNQYQFTFGAGSVYPNVVSYYIVAQDNLGNVGAHPSLGAAGFTTSAPAASTAPSTPTSFVPPLIGTYTVGAGGDFATLTAATTAYNSNGISGSVIFSLTAAQYSSTETFPITFNQNSCATATNTLTIKPATGVSSVITSELASNALIRLNGADYITIDGSNSGTTSRNLTISNTSATAPTGISLISLGLNAGATNNTVRNTIIANSITPTSAAYGLALGGATPGTAGADNDNNTISNNFINGATIGVYASGTTAVTAGANDNLVVSGNRIVSNGTLLSTGISMLNSIGATISLNELSIETTSTTPVAIALQTGVSNTSVTRNVISKVLTTNTGGYGGRGIVVATSNANSGIVVSNNFIYGINGSNWSSFGGSSSMGIGVGVVGTTSTLDNATGGVNIYNNTVSISGEYNRATNCVTTALYVGSAATLLDIRNNILANTLSNTNSSGASSKSYAIYSAAPVTAFTNLDNNNYYTSGSQGVLGFLGSDLTTLAAIRAVGGNASSVVYNPQFVSATDLHLSTTEGVNWTLESAGAPISSVTTDIDGDTRNATTPDIGADEFTASSFVVTNPAAVCAPNTVNITAAAVTAGTTSGTTFTYWTNAAGTITLTTPAAVATSGTYYIKATYGSADNYWIKPVVVVVNPLPTPTITGSATLCATSTGNVYSVTNVTGNTYAWTVTGGTITAGQGTNSITVTAGAAGTATVTVTETITATGCVNTATRVVTINPIPAPVITGQVACTTTEGNIFSVANVTGNTYAWSVAGGTVTAGAGTNAITVTWGAVGAGTVTVTQTITATGCATTVSRAIDVLALPTATAAVVEPVTCASEDGQINLTLGGAAGPYTYAWTGTGNGLSPTTQNQTVVSTGFYNVTVTAANGCTTSLTNIVVAGPGGCFICPTIGTISSTATIICQDGANTITAGGLADLGITYGVRFKYSATPLANPYLSTAGTVMGTVTNANLTVVGGTTTSTSASLTYNFPTAGTMYVYAILSPASPDPACRPFLMIPVEVAPTPVLTDPANQALCTGSTTTAVSFVATPAATTSFAWTNNRTSIGLAASGTGNSIGAFTATNFTNAPVTATVTVTPTNTQTLGTAVNLSTAPNDMTAYRSNVGTVYSMTLTGSNSGGLIWGTNVYTDDSRLSMAAVHAGVLTNGQTGIVYVEMMPGQSSYAASAQNGVTSNPWAAWGGSYRFVSGAGASSTVTCPGPAQTYTYTINPIPTVNTVTDQQICAGTTVSLPFSGFAAGTVFEWTNSNTAIGLAASGAGTLSFTATNTTSSPITGTIVVTPKFTNAGVTCTGNPISFDMVVNPTPVVDAVPAQVLCSGSATTAISLTSATTGAAFSWTNSATSIGLAGTGTGTSIASFTAVNTGAAPVNAIITITPSYTGAGFTCSGTAGTTTITVNPIPSVTAISNSVICNGAATTYTLTGPVTAATYNWTNSNTDIGLAGTGSGTIAFTASNTTAAPISSTITVTPSLANGGLTCTGGTISFTVTVNPSGQVNAIDNQVLCNGSATSAVTFSTINNGLISTGGTQLASSGTISVSVPDNSAVGATHTIPVSLPTGAVITNMRVTMNLTHTWISDMIINLRAPNGQVLNLFNEHGGSGDNLVNTVISSTGTASLASGTAPFTGTYAATAATGVGPTGNASTAANFAALYGTPNGNWVLAMRDLFGGDLGTLTGWSISFDYTVQGQFGTNMNWTNSLSSIGLAATGTGNIPSFTAANTTAAPVVSTVTVTPVYFNSGTSCPGTPATFTYTVNPTPTVSAVANQVFCAGTPATVALSGATTGTVFNWTSSNAAIGLATSGSGDLSFTPTNTSNVPIVSTITVTPSYTNAGVTCTGTPRTFTITVNPVGQVNAVLNQVICNGAGTTAVNFATVNGGGTVQVGTPVTVNSGAITIAVPDFNPAGATHTLPVTLPAGATITGVSVNFNMTHTWLADMVVNLRAPNGQILNLVNRRGGSGDNFVNTAISSASTTSLATGSAPFTGTFAADGALNVGPTTFVSTATNFAALYSVANGDWTLGMRDYAGGDLGTLTGWSITFNYTTVAGAVTTYNWTNTTPSIGLAASGVGSIASFAAANTSTVPVTATVSVTPTYSNAGVACAGPATSFTYTVNPTPTVSAVSSQAVCVGSNVAAVTFAGTVSGTVYNWTNTNTAIGLAASGTGDIPTFVGTNTTSAPISGTITVTPVFTSGGITCNGTPRTFTITVNPIPTVNPVASFPVCHNSTAAVTFSGATTGTVYSWTNSTTSIGLAASGTGNISFTALNTTGAPVVATITVTPRFTNGGTTCTGTPITFTITVNPLPVVSAGTLPARICISDTLVPLNGTPVGGSWSGIGTSGMNFVPPATAVGTWPITYTFRDLNGCTNSATIAATVLACDERNRDLDNRAVFLYPNPNNGQFNLRINSTRFNVLGMRVFNSAGQLVSTKQWSGLVFARVIPVNLTNLPAGVYMVRLYYGDGMDRGADRTFQIIVAR